MYKTNEDGYVNVSNKPSKYDDYLVKTEEGCYDFSHFNINGWSKGQITNGTPLWWREIPTHYQELKNIDFDKDTLDIPNFDDWYENEQPIFHCGQYDDKQIARSAFIEGAIVMQKLIASQKNIEPEFVEIVNKMFFDLID